MKRTLSLVMPSLVVLGLGLASTASAGPLIPPRLTPVVRPVPVLGHGPVVLHGPPPPPVRVSTPTPIVNNNPPAPTTISTGAPGSTLYRNGAPYVVTVAPAGPKLTPARDAMRRLNALRKLTSSTSATTASAPRMATGPGYAPVTFDLGVPGDLGRAPTSADVTVNAGLDGLSPQAAVARVRGKATMPIAQGNSSFVDQTILATHKAFTIGVNNAFTTGSPSNTFIQNNLAGAQVSILGVMSADRPVVIMAKKPTDARSRFYARDSGTGEYVEMPSMPYSVVMKAKLQDAVTSGVRVSYVTWGNAGLSGPLSTVEEMGATVPDINHGGHGGQLDATH